MEDDDGGLFNIEVSSEDEITKATVKVPREFQSEADFQRQAASYKPKIELGEIWKTLKLPIDNPSKPASQTILHAIEELYFFESFVQATEIAEMTLRGNLGADFRRIIEGYKLRCEAKIEALKEDS